MSRVAPIHAPDGATVPAAGTGALPNWNLADLYAAPDSPAIEADLARTESQAKAFALEYEGRLAALPGSDLAQAMARFEAIDETLGRVMSYAQLLFSADSTNPEAGQFYQRMMERVTDISALTLFFRLELNKIDDEVLHAQIRRSGFRALATLSARSAGLSPASAFDELERFIHEREVTGRAAWSRLFDETIAGMRVAVRGEKLTVQRGAEQTLRPRPRAAPGCFCGGRHGVQRPYQTVLADYQHAGQGQGSRRHLAPLSAPGQRAQPVQRRRGRGRRCIGDRPSRRIFRCCHTAIIV